MKDTDISVTLIRDAPPVVDMPPILPSSYYPPFPHTSNSSHSIQYSSIRTRLSAVPLRGPLCLSVVRRGPPSAVARRPPCLALYV